MAFNTKSRPWLGWFGVPSWLGKPPGILYDIIWPYITIDYIHITLQWLPLNFDLWAARQLSVSSLAWPFHTIPGPEWWRADAVMLWLPGKIWMNGPQCPNEQLETCGICGFMVFKYLSCIHFVFDGIGLRSGVPKGWGAPPKIGGSTRELMIVQQHGHRMWVVAQSYLL